MKNTEAVQAMDQMVSQGAIVDAVKKYFAADAKTSDYNNVVTNGKQQMIDKMEGFVGAIAKVNGITHHQTIVGEHTTASEFTFDFDMKDDSKILWHEIIMRKWNEAGEVTSEEYFLA